MQNQSLVYFVRKTHACKKYVCCAKAGPIVTWVCQKITYLVVGLRNFRKKYSVKQNLSDTVASSTMINGSKY